MLQQMKNKLDVLLICSRNDASFKDEYNKFKRKYDELLIERKKNFLQKVIENSDNKIKATWSVVNSLKNQQKERDFPMKGNLNDISNRLNKHFVDHAVNMTKGNSSTISVLSGIEEMNKSIYLKPISLKELESIIRNLKNKHTCGIDGISNSIIKQTMEEIFEPLQIILNNSIKRGVFPEKLKTAVVRPIHKRGNENEFENYRPISILPSISKVFEQAYCKQIMEFLIENKIFSNNQHGYLKGKSIQTAIYQFIKKITDAFEDKNLSLGIFLDLSKAYDCLEVKRLFQKLECYGIRGPALDWVKSYFENRTQLVEIWKDGNRVRSNEEKLQLGVPQGSIAGPLFFIIYMNYFGLQVAWQDGRIANVNYVDDTNLLVVESLWPDLRTLVEGVLETAEKWFAGNNMVLNADKTNMMFFHPPNSKMEISGKITLNNCKYETSQCTKFLGLYIDEELGWKQHVEYLCDKLTSSIYAFRVISKYLDARVLKSVYHATIEAKLRFGVVFYGSGNILPLFILQKKAIRVMNKLTYNQSCRGSFKRLGILTLQALYIQECLLFLHKHRYLFDQHLNLKTRYATRSSTYNFPKCNLTTTQRQLEYRCLKLFNTLPIEIQQIDDLKVFKRKIFSLLLNLEPYSMDEYLGLRS